MSARTLPPVAFGGRLAVREHLRPQPLRLQPATWPRCVQLAALKRVDPVELWPSLRRLTVLARDAGSSDFTISSIDLDIAIAAPTWGKA